MTQLLDITPVTLETASGEVADILRVTQKRLGFIPNMYGYWARFRAF